MAEHQYVLGTGLSHDGSACLLKDGEICVAVEKERLTRIKHDGHNDTAAIAYCLAAAGIGIEDLACVVQNANFSNLPAGNGWWRGRRPDFGRTPVHTISHHLAHAYSALGRSPFEDGRVLVIDGCGSSHDDCIDLAGAMTPEPPPAGLAHLFHEKDSFYRVEGGRLRSVRKDFSLWGRGTKGMHLEPTTTMHSIGGVYLAASVYSFGGLEDAGKLMGLAPLGRPSVHDFPIFDLADGSVLVRYDWQERFSQPARDYAELKANFQHHADLAWWVQREVERAVLYVVASRHAADPAENLMYAGGVALNAVANARILREGPYRRLYVQPAAGDNGLAIGCAYFGWLEALGRPRVPPTTRTTFGIEYSLDACVEAARELGSAVHVEVVEDVVGRAAAMLADGRILGWFQGGSEFGPRALGHRSILADPRRAEVRDFVNREVKFREDFRPFAPAVRQEDAHRYFECIGESPHMLLVFAVRSEWRAAMPAVVHADGSARVQTVRTDEDPRFHALLGAFGERTGLPVLLNTSLNCRGMPIVETPSEALSLFLRGGLDALVMDRVIVTKLEPTA